MGKENMNRRTAVGVLGSLALSTVASAWGRHVLAQPVCTLTPEQIEGPFYLDQARIREDISEGKPGVPLDLVLRVLEASASARRSQEPQWTSGNATRLVSTPATRVPPSPR